MGTRHLTAVVLDGQYKIAQYGQWDGYPDGQGMTILTFLHDEFNRALFENKVRALRFGTAEELQAEWTACGADPNSPYVTFEVSAVHKERYPQNSRDTGAGILKIVQDGPDGMALFDDLAFAANSLFCEWAYVIDLDRNTFEVFEGFNETKLGNGERFYFLQDEEKMKADKEPYTSNYYPVKLVVSFSLMNLPAAYTFLQKCQPNDELPEGITGQEPGLSTTTPDKES